MVDKITTVIGKPVRNIRLRLHVELVRKFNSGRIQSFHNEFNYNDKDYQAFDFGRYVTLEYTEGDWSKDKSIMITESNLYTIRRRFREMVRNMYQPDTFVQKKDGELILPEDMRAKYTVNIFDLGMNQYMVLKPTIVTDLDGITYEGVAMYFNKSGICAALSITEFEALNEALNKIDLFLYSHQLLSVYLQLADKIDIIKTGEDTNKKKTNVFEKDMKEVQYKTTQLNKEEFFGLGGNKDGL